MSTFRYAAAAGLAAQYVGDLSAEMRDLDMPPGTVVTVVGHDDERDLVLVEWTDLSGNGRVTSIEPAVFAENFTEE